METQRAAPFLCELPAGPDSKCESSGIGDRAHSESVVHELSGTGDSGRGEELVRDRAEGWPMRAATGDRERNPPFGGFPCVDHTTNFLRLSSARVRGSVSVDKRRIHEPSASVLSGHSIALKRRMVVLLSRPGMPQFTTSSVRRSDKC